MPSGKKRRIQGKVCWIASNSSQQSDAVGVRMVLSPSTLKQPCHHRLHTGLLSFIGTFMKDGASHLSLCGMVRSAVYTPSSTQPESQCCSIAVSCNIAMNMKP